MPDTVRFEVKGLRELGEKMRELGEKKAVGAGRSATSAAATVIKKRVKTNIISNPSVETGSLRDAVIVKKVPKSETELSSEHMVTFRGRGKPKINKKGVKQAQAPHANLVEFGTVHMAAEPSLGPAFDSEHQRALEAMIERLRKRLFT